MHRVCNLPQAQSSSSYKFRFRATTLERKQEPPRTTKLKQYQLSNTSTNAHSEQKIWGQLSNELASAHETKNSFITVKVFAMTGGYVFVRRAAKRPHAVDSAPQLTRSTRLDSSEQQTSAIHDETVRICDAIAFVMITTIMIEEQRYLLNFY